MATKSSNTITIDTSQVTRWCDKVSSDTAIEVKKFITLGLKRGADIVQHKEATEVPRGVSGSLAKSLKQVVTDIAAVIGPDHKLNYPLYVVKGTKPHMPPVDAITAWADAKGINPWALAMSIKQKGTKANPFVERTYKASKPEVLATWLETTKLIRDFIAKA